MQFLIFSLLIIFYSSLSFAQVKFKVDVDYCRYLLDDSSSFVEIYYSFYKSFVEEDKKIINGSLNILIQNIDTQNTLIDKEWKFDRVIDSLSNQDFINFTGVLGFRLPFGLYGFTVIGKEFSKTILVDSSSFKVDLSNYPAEMFSISDIQLATSIKQVETNSSSLFYKNSYEVTPNPVSFYGDGLFVLYHYSEFYNLNLNLGTEVVTVETKIVNSLGRGIHRKVKYAPRMNSSIVNVGAINISKLPSGKYTLIITIADSLKSLTSSSSKVFFVYNPLVVDTTYYSNFEDDFIVSEFSVLEEVELSEIFKLIKYTAKADELDQWDRLVDIEGKRKFMYNFWKLRDPDPKTPFNEVKTEYFNRVAYSNTNFGTSRRQGWKTDRGRVYILYGEPSEIERFPYQSDAKPYEIWKYNNLEGGVIFVFADLTGFSNYELLHSTLRGELCDDNWNRRVYIQ